MEGEVEIVTEVEKEPAWVVKDWESSSESAKSDEIQLIGTATERTTGLVKIKGWN